jgi:anti-sigma regulatory factor (Ser/Thr protein kinase)
VAAVDLFRTKSLEHIGAEGDGTGEGATPAGVGRLHRHLSAHHLVGIVIGTGIFTLTGVEARDTAGPAVVLSFAIAGVVALRLVGLPQLAAARPPGAGRAGRPGRGSASGMAGRHPAHARSRTSLPGGAANGPALAYRGRDRVRHDGRRRFGGRGVTAQFPDGASDPPRRRYRHDALIYDSTATLVDVAAPFLLDGLAAGDAAVIATSAGTAEALREAVGDDPRVHVVARADVYRARTPAVITTFRRLAKEWSPGDVGRVRVVGEADFGTTERDWLEWQRYEAVINEALTGWRLWGLCVFDADRLPQPVLDSAVRTHQSLVTRDGRAPNPAFTDPADYLRSLPVPPEPLLDTAPRLSVPDVADFIGLRHAVAAELRTLNAPRDLVEDFLLAVDEMTSNAVRHGRPPIGLRLWIATDRIVCTIEDRGAGWDDPFAGYGPAHGKDLSRGGMGLWLARQLCDHVDISQDGEGVSVRLTTRLG